jgi:hypothetical protein
MRKLRVWSEVGSQIKIWHLVSHSQCSLLKNHSLFQNFRTKYNTLTGNFWLVFSLNICHCNWSLAFRGMCFYFISQNVAFLIRDNFQKLMLVVLPWLWIVLTSFKGQSFKTFDTLIQIQKLWLLTLIVKYRIKIMGFLKICILVIYLFYRPMACYTRGANLPMIFKYLLCLKSV